MARRSRKVVLSNAPVVLVLCQVVYSRVQVGEYATAIQEDFRKAGLPVERRGKMQQVIFAPSGLQVAVKDYWDYRTADQRTSFLVMDDSVVLQTTAYKDFEAFIERLERCLHTVLTRTEHDQHGVIHRIGLRYINVIGKPDGKSYSALLSPGLHGAPDGAFEKGTRRVRVETTGRTRVGDGKGTFVVRVSQSDDGTNLPPDIVGTAPLYEPRSGEGEIATLLDMDHFVEGNFRADAARVAETLHQLHDHIVESFHRDLVTKKAIQEWL